MTTNKKTPFSSVLVANRGEIACRIMRTAKAMGLKTIAVYSDADANAPHVKMADKAIHIGPSPVGESYLVIEKIIGAAKESGAESIHPGYGFLSENAEFATACDAAGLVFIGPPIDAIDLMGDKAKSKRRMIAAGVPCVPGYQGEVQDDATLIREAKSIGFPVMVKAAAGGGGRGMRFVHTPQDLSDAITNARSEAANAFGSDFLILERAVQQPRHVEIQVFADKYGHTIHLGERDCSVQRRHQKVLEEAPCPIMTPELRKAMGDAAVKAAQDIGYVGAGTVEFMLDTSGEFFFLEMNTRLQVEHPVTELITGLDLVALQIQVARGEALALTQNDITLSGHAVEARLYAEDPTQDFLPATGPVDMFIPASGEGIRIDSGIESGGEVSPFYDPMIAKVIGYGPTRNQAIRNTVKALKDTALFGLKTNRAFLIDALEHQVFKAGAATTAFIGENFPPDVLTAPRVNAHIAAIAAVIQYETSRDASLASSLDVTCELLNWSSTTPFTTPYRYLDGDTPIEVGVTPNGLDYHVTVEETEISISVVTRSRSSATLNVNGTPLEILFYAPAPGHISVSLDGVTFDLMNQNQIFTSAADAAGAGAVLAPMHGALLEVFVKNGEAVKTGQRLAILEAMKMQHEILAEVDGTITAINVTAGNQIAADTLMIEIEAINDV